MIREFECDCCKNKFKSSDIKSYKWKLDGKLYCSFGCYSKVYDSKYKSSKFTKEIEIGYKRDRTGR